MLVNQMLLHSYLLLSMSTTTPDTHIPKEVALFGWSCWLRPTWSRYPAPPNPTLLSTSAFLAVSVASSSKSCQLPKSLPKHDYFFFNHTWAQTLWWTRHQPLPITHKMSLLPFWVPVLWPQPQGPDNLPGSCSQYTCCYILI